MHIERNRMLILTRKQKEAVTVIVPPSTEPTVVELVVQMTTSKATKIGFTAPIAVDIRRDNIKKGKRNG